MPSSVSSKVHCALLSRLIPLFVAEHHFLRELPLEVFSWPSVLKQFLKFFAELASAEGEVQQLEDEHRQTLADQVVDDEYWKWPLAFKLRAADLLVALYVESDSFRELLAKDEETAAQDKKAAKELEDQLRAAKKALKELDVQASAVTVEVKSRSVAQAESSKERERKSKMKKLQSEIASLQTQCERAMKKVRSTTKRIRSAPCGSDRDYNSYWLYKVLIALSFCACSSQGNRRILRPCSSPLPMTRGASFR
jgi:hypothetical protein